MTKIDIGPTALVEGRVIKSETINTMISASQELVALLLFGRLDFIRNILPLALKISICI